MVAAYPISEELRAAGVQFRERFRSDLLIRKNGLIPVNEPVFGDDGMEVNGTTQYATIQRGFSIDPTRGSWFKVVFTPDFAYDEDVMRFLFADPGSAGSTLAFGLYKHNTANSYALVFATAEGYVYVTGANYSAYWRQGERNTIVACQAGTACRKMWLNGNLLTAGVASLTSIVFAEYIEVGRSVTYSGYFDGVIHEFVIGEGVLTDDDAAALYTDDIVRDVLSENSTLVLPLTDQRDDADGVELLKDADCRAITWRGVWLQQGNATITKPIDPALGRRVMRVTRGAGASWAQQSVTVATATYRVRGKVKSDGVGVPILYDSGAVAVWTGTASTATQEFDVTYTAAGIAPYFWTNVGGYVEWWDLSVQRVRSVTPALGAGSRRVLGPELLTDGDMEASGTAAWTPGNNAALSKQSSDLGAPSTQCLRIAYVDTSTPYTTQGILTVGKRYRVSGYAQGDGTYLPFMGLGGAALWTGTTSTSWQYFEVEGIAELALALLYGNCTGAGYVEFDMVSIKEIEHAGVVPRLGADGLTPASYPKLIYPRGMSFDGGDLIRIPDSNGFSFGDGAGNDMPFSLVWYGRVTALPSVAGVFFAKRTDSVLEYTNYISSAGIIYWILNTNASNSISQSVDLSRIVGKDVVLVFTYNGSKVNTGLKVYCDGKLCVSTPGGGGTYTGMIPSDRAVTLMSDDTPAYYLTGNVYAAEVFPCALPPAEVRAETARLDRLVRAA